MSVCLHNESIASSGDGAGNSVSVAGLAAMGLSASWIGPEEWDEWDRFVEGHPDGMIYHLGGWRRFLEKEFPHIEGHGLVLRCLESGEIRAGIPVYVARSRVLGDRVLSVPFGTLGGALVSEPEHFRLLAAELTVFRDKLGCGRMEIRGVRHFDDALNGSVFSASSGFLHHYLELNRPLEDLRKSFARDVRYSISRSVKSQVEIEMGGSEADQDEYSRLLAVSRRRLNLPIFPCGFVHEMFKRLPDSAVRLVVARKDGEVVGGLLELRFRDWTIYEQVADSALGRSMRVNHLLLWRSIEEAVAEGRRYYSFGRTSADNEGLVRFKRAWGTVEEPLWNLALPPWPDSSDPAAGEGLARRAVRWGMGNFPLPLAKKLSEVFYRHWA